MAAQTPQSDLRKLQKNYIINGDMRIAQRNTSFTSIANTAYGLDRWRYAKVGGMVHNLTQDTDVPTVAQAGYLFLNSLRLNLTAADTSIAPTDLCAIQQFVEGYNWAYLAQKAFTLSFWVKATLPGTYCVSFRNAVAIDRSYIAEYTINAANTWEKKEIKVSASPAAGNWNYANGIGLNISWMLANGSAQQTTAGSWQSGDFLSTANQVNGVNTGATDFRITGVMLNEGNETQSFRLYADGFDGELAACQRYYEKSYSTGVFAGAVGDPSYWAYSSQASGAVRRITMAYRVRKRVAPSVTIYSINGNINQVTRDVSGDQGISSVYGGETMWGYEIGSSAADPRTYCHFVADAEL